MRAIATTAAVMGASLRRRARRASRAGADFLPPGSAVALRHRLFVSGTSGAQAFRGRAVAVAVGGAGPTRYLVDDAERGESRWIAETDIAHSTPLAPGDAVIGYVTVRDGGRPGATRASRASIRRACAREGWRLAGVVCDHARRAVGSRPGLRAALDRIASGSAAGLVVADLDAATAGSDEALAALMAVVRRAGGGLVALNDDDVAVPPRGRRPAAAAARARVAELRDRGMAPLAIADALNEEGVATLGPDPLWRAWSVREAGGTGPPRGPRRRRPRL
jgi:resolvase-like protein